MHRSTLAAVVAIALLPLAALAQSTAPKAPGATEPAATDAQEARGKVRTACAGDIQKFCANIERAKGAMRSCLEAHENDLTATCKAARAERAAERAKTKS
jgi:predicted outer membrane protein